jgi:molybdopterin/thiamine biosynthesis adenylyltransferase
MAIPAVLLPISLAEAIAASKSSSGTLNFIQDRSEDLLVVSGWNRPDRYGGRLTDEGHYTRAWTGVNASGLWYEVDEHLHELGRFGAIRGGAVSIDDFQQRVKGGWKRPQTAGSYVLTFVRRSASLPPDWVAWFMTEEAAELVAFDLYDPRGELLAPLTSGWPLHKLEGLHATVIGVGSIGSVACEALASYGIRRFTLIDPDRLLAHNFARHRALRTNHGRLKVNAVGDLLLERDSAVEVERLPLDVATHADLVRPGLANSDVVIGCPDGTRARRMVSHLAYRAGKPVVLGCVLEQGAFGEVLRLVPGRNGCLLCNRAALRDAFDAEVGLDAGYDAGNPHLAMTAVTGDLALVGHLVAKAAVSTLMERRGERGEKLAGDHGAIALRPLPGFPAPFDFSAAGQVRWVETAQSRPTCPTCGERGS